jgi:hypothetical protein
MRKKPPTSGSDIHVMLALRRRFRQVVVADEQLEVLLQKLPVI